VVGVPQPSASREIDEAGVARGSLERIVYEGPDGRRSEDIGDVLPESPALSLANLALLFANPSVELCYIPEALWADVRLKRVIEPWPDPHGGRLDDLCGRFRESVRASCGASDPVVVSFSGGLDSLAVLYHADAVCREDGRRLVAAVADLEDDRGTRTAHVARGLVDALGIACELVTFDDDPAHAEQLPAWSATGPNYAAMPAVVARLIEYARRIGGQVVLNGSGADELFMCTRFLTQRLIALRRYRAALHYASDMWHYDGVTTLLGELARPVASRLSPRWQFNLLYALLWHRVHDPLPCKLVGPSFADAAVEYHRQWAAHQYSACEENGFRWPAIAARAAVYPRDNMPAPEDIAELSPFMQPDFVRFAHGIDFGLRYCERHGDPYHRTKAAVIALFPHALVARLPREKQTYAKVLDRYFERALSEPPKLCLELGLIADDWSKAMHDDRLSHVVHVVETWLRQAIARGATVPHDR